MSAYGSIAAPEPKTTLAVRTWDIKNPDCLLWTFPVVGSDAPSELLHHVHHLLNTEIQDGKTYPQETPLKYEEFVAYYFSSVTIIGLLVSVENNPPETLEEARCGQSWEVSLGGTYYIKPNYPGRSSHNAGFLVPEQHRGRGVGAALAKSFCEYAPQLGYKSSVFNLVYANNTASLRLWDSLGFSRVGLIPQAGRLRSGPEGGEEYVDAVVIYKSFV
ncbi:hypothetical protein TREMEDRAFT_68045 [Tremella mesenterica DSM 1558]|uniref:uncharacterized protein n=1 Tax=Tremella mesenterica (strain ATCC 24925 / CBS 8224 / DSM 1558 / NBRC 9311 / NRRL Y-6157 / RJB 2259-6 / UBC 559-6) TaxID=578456 RepID=UPI0003F49354|nr:uncharacterized protein TREMEDRAFT_68045 [Tremella mesenterica DSM 1558]EIW70420.1 hypothetical protein TREMEDRAFT_68045 [Tremella mesenterica DSM 1558]